MFFFLVLQISVTGVQNYRLLFFTLFDNNDLRDLIDTSNATEANADK